MTEQPERPIDPDAPRICDPRIHQVPAQTEQQFLGNTEDENEAGMPYAAASDYVDELAKDAAEPCGRPHYGEVHVDIMPKLPPAFRPELWPAPGLIQRRPHERLNIFFNPQKYPSAFPEPRTDLLVEAETAAHHASKSFENGEVLAGIAWSKAAVNFAEAAQAADSRATIDKNPEEQA